MEQQTPSPRLVSTERTVTALTWLRTFLSSHTSASLSASLSSGLEPSPPTVLSIETLRSAIESRISAAQAAADALHAQAKSYEEARKKWEEAGATQLLEQLDHDAVQEARTLADAAAALELPLEAALDKGVAVAAASELAAGLLSDAEAVEERKEALAEAQAALRDGAALAARGTEGEAVGGEKVAERRKEAERWKGKVDVMEKKRVHYEGRAREERERVRNAGVEKECRHERVVEMGKRLRERESRVEEVEKAVRRFAGLPADLEECQHIVAKLHADIANVDAEIQAAIGSISR